jgi:hypothetical protein
MVKFLHILKEKTPKTTKKIVAKKLNSMAELLEKEAKNKRYIEY